QRAAAQRRQNGLYAQSPTAINVGSGLDHADIWQVSVTLAIIEPIAHDEFIRNLETDVFESDFNDAAGPAIQQRAHLKRFRISSGQRPQKIFQRETRVDNVLNDEHILAGDIFFEVLRNSNDAFTVFAIAGNRQEI